MRRHPAIPVLLIGPATLAIGLAGCNPHMYDTQQLSGVSRPAPVLLASLPEPDCATPTAVTKAKAKGDKEQKAKKAEDVAEASEEKADDKTKTAKADETSEKPDKDDEPATQAAKPTETSIMAAAAAEGEEPKPADSKEALRKERDCYRRAEKRARDRLQQLQASTNEAFDAMNAAKNGRQSRGPIYRYQNDGTGADRQESYLSFDQLRARGS